MTDSKRHRAVIEAGDEPSGEFERLLVETIETSDFMEVDVSGDVIHVYETGPFRDVALNNLPFGPLADNATVGDDKGNYAECHIIDNRDDVEYAGVWYHSDDEAWKASKPTFVLKSGSGASADTIELTEGQAKHIVHEHSGWNYVE